VEPQKDTAGRQKSEAAVKLLAMLKQKLYCGDVSRARRAAHNLSWMQDDGLAILKEALLSNSNGATKNAACYGLRHMQGRMKKEAIQVLIQALQYPNNMTRDLSKKALQMSRAQV
jgi:hypothetical protein